MSTINSICTDNGTQIDINLETNETQVTAPNGATMTYSGDDFTFGSANGTQSFQIQADSAIPPGHQGYGHVPPASQDDVANVVQAYGNQNAANSNSPTPPANGSGGSGGTGNAPGSTWAKKIDELYAKLESSEKLSTEEMQKLQMQMQQAMQMFQLYTQMMTAMHEAKKDAGRQIRY